MPASDHARFFSRTDVVDNEGAAVRANSEAENALLRAIINSLYSNPNVANFFGLDRIAEMLGESVVFRSIPLEAEDDPPGSTNFNAKHRFGTLNDPILDVTAFSRDFFGDPTIHINLKETWQQLGVNGQAQTRSWTNETGTNVPQSILHEIIHAYHRGVAESGGGYNVGTDLEYEEQITIFMENFLYEKLMTRPFDERVGHSTFQPAHFGASASAISYLSNYSLTAYQFSEGDLKASFVSADGLRISKTYIAGFPRNMGSLQAFERTAGADRIEIHLTGAGLSPLSAGVLSDAQMLPVLQESAVLAGVLDIVKGSLDEFNELARTQRHTFTPQALLVFSAERYIGGEKSALSGNFRVDVEGPRPNEVGVLELRVPSGFFGFDLHTLLIGGAGWSGRDNSAKSVLDFSTMGGPAIDVLTGGGGNDILVSFSEGDFNRLEGMGGNDLLLGSDKIDIMRGGIGNDSLNGFESGDQLYGDEGDDWLMGGGGPDELQGGSNNDVLWGGAGFDIMDGGSGADILVVDGIDIIRPGEAIDKLYLRSFDPADPQAHRLVGGYRFVNVNDTQTYAQQLEAMRNSTAPFVGSMGEEYRVFQTSSGQGLEIKVGDEIISIDSWNEGEYGIRLHTERNRVSSFEYLSLPSGGFPAGGLGLTADFIEIQLNTVMFIASRSYDPVWGTFSGSSYTLTQLDQLLGQPVIPPRSNSIEGTDQGEAINGRLGDDRLHGHGGNDQLAGLVGSDDLYGGDGDDSLDGGLGADLLEGGEGDDVLAGRWGDDTIDGGLGADLVLFAAGDGHDRVNGDDGDVIRFDGSLNSATVAIYRSSGAGPNPEYGSIADGGFTFAFGADALTIEGLFAQVEFADGTILTQSSLLRQAIAASTTTGDDVIVGAATPDRLAGGAGNDFLSGGYGNDVYVFERGDGHDRIEDWFHGDDVHGIADVLMFGEDIAPGDIIVTGSLIATGNRTGVQLVRLAISGTSDWVEFPVSDVEEVRFADGTRWNRLDIGSRAMDSGTGSGNDVLGPAQIFSGTIRPGSGDDVLTVNQVVTVSFGRGSNLDRILFSEGFAYGIDIEVDPDVALGELRFGRTAGGLAMWIDGTGHRIEGQFEGGIRSTSFVVAGERMGNMGALADLDDNAVQHLIGTSAGETITGSADGDRISAGSGNDVVGGGGGADLLFGGSGNDSMTGGAGRDFIFGESGDDVLDGGDGDDVLAGGAGTDTLLGGAGNDAMSGNGSTTMSGGTGVDSITLTLGDRLLYNLGDGADIVHLSYADFNAEDGSTTVERGEIEFGAGITAAATTLTLQGWTVFINVNGSITDRIRLDRFFQGGDLPTIRFHDGTVWAEADFYAKIFNPNNGNDTPAAVQTSDPEWSGQTIQYVYGGGGNDTLRFTISEAENNFVFAPGGGNDTITGSAEGQLFLLGFDVDALLITRFGSKFEDVTLSFIGSTDSVTIENLYEASGATRLSDMTMNGARLWDGDLARIYIRQNSTAGNDTIRGFDGPGGIANIGEGQPIWWQYFGNDRIEGGLGDDLMIGGSGDDTYVVSEGDGQDTIRDISLFDANAEAGHDVLQLDVDSGDVSFSRSPADLNDLVISFAGSTQSILVDQFFAKGRIEELRFADGVILTGTDVDALAIAGSVTAGSDSIRGTSVAETLAGGTGNDTLDGLAGSDRYVFNLGDGQDVISDSGANGIEQSRLRGRNCLRSADVHQARQRSQDRRFGKRQHPRHGPFLGLGAEARPARVRRRQPQDRCGDRPGDARRCGHGGGRHDRRLRHQRQSVRRRRQ